MTLDELTRFALFIEALLGKPRDPFTLCKFNSQRPCTCAGRCAAYDSYEAATE